MSFFRNLIDSFSQFFSVSDPSSARHHDPQLMDASASAAAGPSVVSERVVNKLKGYFDLAKEEIDKAVRAEEWGLTDDAIAHYKNAHRVMLEAKAARVPSAMPSRSHILNAIVELGLKFMNLMFIWIDSFDSDQEKVRIYQQKISKWQENVTERLQVLSKRTGMIFIFLIFHDFFTVI